MKDQAAKDLHRIVARALRQNTGPSALVNAVRAIAGKLGMRQARDSHRREQLAREVAEAIASLLPGLHVRQAERQTVICRDTVRCWDEAPCNAPRQV